MRPKCRTSEDPAIWLVDFSPFIKCLGQADCRTLDSNTKRRADCIHGQSFCKTSLLDLTYVNYMVIVPFALKKICMQIQITHGCNIFNLLHHDQMIFQSEMAPSNTCGSLPRKLDLVNFVQTLFFNLNTVLF